MEYGLRQWKFFQKRNFRRKLEFLEELLQQEKVLGDD